MGVNHFFSSLASAFKESGCLLGSVLAVPALASAQSLCINEIMQSNIDCYFTEHDFPDSWVELYNPTAQAIDLCQYSIGLSSNPDSAYVLTEHLQLAAGAHLLVLCDKVASGLHTDFRLESKDEGHLYLFAPDGALVDSLSHPAMPTSNIAYGRIVDGGSSWGWELTPTPGQANGGGTSDLLLPKPDFSMKGQVMSGSATVTITMPEGDYPADTRIYVTTDGSEPTRASSSGTSFTFNLTKTTILQAKLLSDSALCRRSTTRSYIFHPRQMTMPILSLVTDDDYLYSSAEGILSDAMTDGTANYKYDWRRPVNVEYFDSLATEPVFNQVGETAVAGVASRVGPQRSMKLFAHKRFGDKRYKGDFWADKPGVRKVKSMILRNGGNNRLQARINDAMVQRLFGTHGDCLDYQAYAPVIVYINGVYKGVFGLRERANEDYVEANYDGLEDIEMNDQRAYQYDYLEGATSPSWTDFYNLYHRDDVTYDELAAVIDIDNFIQVLIAEMYTENSDYPHNNIAVWRPTAEDGKWRWILKDMDFFAYNEKTPVQFNMFKYIFGPVYASDFEYTFVNDASRYRIPRAEVLYQKLIAMDEFRTPFIDRFAVWLGDFLKPSVSVALVDEMNAEIRKEVSPTFKAYNGMSTLTVYDRRIDSLREHCRLRPAIIYRQMAEHFDLGDVIPMTVQRGTADVTICGIHLTEGDFDGAWFTNHPLTLCSGSDDLGWKVHTFSQSASGQWTENGDVLTFEHPTLSFLLSDYPNCKKVCFEPYEIVHEAIAQLSSDDSLSPREIWSLSGQRLSRQQQGLNVIRRADGSVQKTLIGK